MRRSCVLVLGAVVSVCGCGAAFGDVHLFLDNPTGNSADFSAYSASKGFAINSTIDFATHPDGAVVPTWYLSSDGVKIQTSAEALVATGQGSLAGNNTDPDGIGEGVMPEPARYLLVGRGSGTSTVDLEFTTPVAAVGVMTADLFMWGDPTPNATFEAFDSAGVSLGSSPALNQSFEFDFLYFMGVVDDDARIARVVITTYGIAGDTVYFPKIMISSGFVCPCPADFDGSGGTPDSTDIDAFFTQWLAGDPSADADCSGGTPDSTDINAFFAAWLAGGC